MNKIQELLQGNEACVKGAIYAGMRFFAGYPITPSTEITELASVLLPKYGGKFIQMEDEIASMAAVIGASLCGVKSMTATSGPGFSLKQENIGYSSMCEIPCVIVNVQRGGPSTGLPTYPSQADLMQSRWGTHGDHPIIVLTPISVQDTFELTIRAFNFSEKYRVPVILLMDEVVAHMREKFTLPDEGSIEVINRKEVEKSVKECKLYEHCENNIPPMAHIGDGNRINITGLVHDEYGFPTNDVKEADRLIKRLMNKIDLNLEDIQIYEEYLVKDADFMIISYGISARASMAAVDILRAKGYNCGLFIPKTIWPFPLERINILSQKLSHIFVCEMNMGQMILEVERITHKQCVIRGINKSNGEIIEPKEMIDIIEEALNAKQNDKRIF